VNKQVYQKKKSQSGNTESLVTIFLAPYTGQNGRVSLVRRTCARGGRVLAQPLTRGETRELTLKGTGPPSDNRSSIKPRGEKNSKAATIKGEGH